jgi:pyrroloquinoline quinone (PQQ) biosynthesis protein C
MALESAARRAAALADGHLAERLAGYAADQEERIDLWLRFAVATGWDGSAWYFGEDPLPETVACRRAWAGGDSSLAEHLVTIHAAETALARIAPLQLDALTSRYGFGERATLCFRLRAERWNDSALAAAPVLVDQAELTCRSYLELLDGVATARSPSG